MTQFEMHAVEALGLLKFDFLGLSNLTILRQAVELVRAHRGVEIDLEAIPLDDPTTFELLASGETTGIFQLESAGMRRYVRELRPTSVYDLAAMVALYRPGPMDNIPAYIRRKHGQEPVTYLHPLLEPYLEKTYGIFVYQEDIMAAAMGLGGFSGPEADTLGYAIRKKKSSVLRAQKEKFVTRAAERGRPGRDDRRRVQGVRAVRALRLQQGPRHLLRPRRLPDRVPQGELHGRVHDERAHARSATPPRRSPRRSPSAAGSGIEVLPPDVHAVRRRVHRRGRRDPLRAPRGQERRPGRDRVDHRRPGRGWRVPLADRPVLADRPPAGEPEGPRGAGAGGRPQRVRPPGTDPARARRRAGRRRRRAARPDHRARRRCSRWPPSRPPSTPRCRRSRRPRPASGSAGRRSSSGCTCPTIRSARSPRRSGRS